jgi:thioredoxin 1
MAGKNIHEFTDDNFAAEVIGSDKPVLVDFWAEWCMPCRMLAPTIDEIAGEFTDKVKVGKVDTDKNQQISVNYRITAIPTVIIFKGGEVKKKFVGLTNKGDLRNALNELVGA